MDKNSFLIIIILESNLGLMQFGKPNKPNKQLFQFKT